MIPELDTTVLDLGKDRERVTTANAERQTTTVNHLLRTFCGPLATRREVQILADEVGMGKTYVALATAYTLLSQLRDTARCRELDDLKDCCKCVLVITPSGSATLADKWNREGEAMLTRCSLDSSRTAWFRSLLCESPDQLLQAIYRANDLRRRNEPVVLVAQSNIFTKRLSDPAVRFVVACLFRWWGNGLPMKERYHLVLGLSETTGSGTWQDAAQWKRRGQYEVGLWDWVSHERYLSSSDEDRANWEPREERKLFSEISLTYEQVSFALGKLVATAEGNNVLEKLRQACKSVPLRRPSDQRTTAYREWVKYFRDRKDELRDVFKQLWRHLLAHRPGGGVRVTLPMVIADESHHWRNNAAGDFRAMRDYIAPYSRRLLLLTATPFQLEPQETVNILNVIDHVEPAIGEERTALLKELRTTLSICMTKSEQAGLAFSKEWGALADQMNLWQSGVGAPCAAESVTVDPRTKLIEDFWLSISHKPGHAAETTSAIPSPLRPFFLRALELQQANKQLQAVMGKLVVRHRRATEHRRYWIGREYPPSPTTALRPDQSRLHLAPGQSLEPKDELIQYLLMKVVAAVSKGRHKTSLGTALTGCYSTMWESNEGRKALAAIDHENNKRLIALLQKMTGESTGAKDAEHPKVRKVVEALLERWDRGEKSLVFCFRIPTANALKRILSDRIGDRLRSRRDALFEARGTMVQTDEDRDAAMRQFRRTLTARDSSGVPLFLDRVLAHWFRHLNLSLPTVSTEDIAEVAALAARATFNKRRLFASADRPDRVFLMRALEHVLARKIQPDLSTLPVPKELFLPTKDLVSQVAHSDWVRYRYGRPELSTGTPDDQDSSAERTARSGFAATYELDDASSGAQFETLKEELIARFQQTRTSVFSTLLQGPNLVAPPQAVLEHLPLAARDDAEAIGKSLLRVTLRRCSFDWVARRDAIDAVVRAVLRDDLLLRLPVSVFQGQDETWAASLFTGLHTPLGGKLGTETLAQRFVAFLDELARMEVKERELYLEHAMNPNAEAVALVQGGDKKNRAAIFSGFNTPLLPEILICTSVGQEGIDLHRECSHVVHYDLGWNPAMIEQRTGRVDRIGSKTERERKLAVRTDDQTEHKLPGLDVALPYLAATYDDRMFDRLRTRAQIFEILTGGDPTADREAIDPWAIADEEGTDFDHSFISLPEALLTDLKIDLSVQSVGRPASAAAPERPER